MIGLVRTLSISIITPRVTNSREEKHKKKRRKKKKNINQYFRSVTRSSISINRFLKKSIDRIIYEFAGRIEALPILRKSFTITRALQYRLWPTIVLSLFSFFFLPSTLVHPFTVRHFSFHGHPPVVLLSTPSPSSSLPPVPGSFLATIFPELSFAAWNENEYRCGKINCRRSIAFTAH